MSTFSAIGVAADIARDLFVRLQTGLVEQQETAPLIYPSACSTFDSQSKTNRYDFAKNLAVVREFTGERVFNKVKAYDYELTNKSWEVSMEWSVDEIEDDQTGMLKSAIDDHIAVAVEDPDVQFANMVAAHIANTVTTYGPGFDAKSIFAADHTWGSDVPYTTAQDNILAGSNAGKLDPTYGAANLQTAYDTLSHGFFWPNGRRIRQRPTHLYCSPSVAWYAKELTGSKNRLSGNTNTLGIAEKNGIADLNLEVVTVPGLATGTWYMACEGRGVKPFVFQNRKALETTMDESLLFNNRIFRAGTFARYQLGAGLWFRAIAGDGT